jgi:septum formation protein
MKKIILASSSPNRKELLHRFMLDFTCHSPDIDESPLPNEKPEDLALRLSLEKAQKIAAIHPDAIVIGSDQVCAAGSHIVNKPETHDKALTEWAKLSGETVVFYTGIAVVDGDEYYLGMVPTELRFKSLSAQDYEAYLNKDKPYGCCAGFKIESLGIILTEWVKSEDPTALIGLPLIKTAELLEQCGIKLLDY